MKVGQGEYPTDVMNLELLNLFGSRQVEIEETRSDRDC